MGKRGGPVRSSCPLLDTSAAVFLGRALSFLLYFRRPKIALDCRARYRHMMRYSYSQHKKWLLMPAGMNTHKKVQFSACGVNQKRKIALRQSIDVSLNTIARHCYSRCACRISRHPLGWRHWHGKRSCSWYRVSAPPNSSC